MGVNKVVYGDRTLVDLTDATATAETVLAGYTAYGANGERIVGTAGSTVHKAVNVTLPLDKWLDNEQIVNVDYATEDAMVIVGGDNGSQPEYSNCEVWCSGQEDGRLTFSCTYPPGEDVVANVGLFLSRDMIIPNATGSTIQLTDASDRKLRGLTIYGKTTQNGTPSPENPVPLESVGDGDSVGVTVCGKNLLSVGEFDNNSVNQNIINGHGIPYHAGTKLCFSAKAETISASDSRVQIALSTDKIQTALLGEVTNRIAIISKANIVSNQSISVPVQFDLDGYLYVRVVHYTGMAFSDMQLEIGDTATAFEPYKGQTLTLSTPNGLPGIHVSKGGNYTDENGWQWICDEVDFAKGVYVQRVLQNVFNGSENWEDRTEVFTQKQDGQYRFSLNNPFSVKYGKLDERVESTYGLSDWGSVKGLHGVANKSADGFTLYTTSQALYIGYITTSQYTSLEELKYGLSNNPLTVLAILETPIETALSAEQLAAYAALHTYSPSTTIYNDAGSYMEVKYVADSKNCMALNR